MNTYIYDHMSGGKAINFETVSVIIKSIESLHPKLIKYSVSGIKRSILESLYTEGWSKEYRLDYYSKITITSYRNGVGMCVQTGNTGRIYADLLKLQLLYSKKKLSAGIIVIPMKQAALKLGSNMACFERLVRELPIFEQVISIPIVVVGFDNEEG